MPRSTHIRPTVGQTRRRSFIIEVLLGLIVSALLGAFLVVGFHIVTEPEPAASLPPCVTEDSDNCYWNGADHGNGSGASFIIRDGIATYDDGTVIDWNER